MTLAEMQALLAALLGMRFGGVRSITYDGRQITYGSDAELATAIFDLERRIAAADTSVARSRVSRPFASKDLCSGPGPTGAHALALGSAVTVCRAGSMPPLASAG